MHIIWTLIGFLHVYLYMSWRLRGGRRMSLVDIPISALILVSGVFAPFVLALAIVVDLGPKNVIPALKNWYRNTK